MGFGTPPGSRSDYHESEWLDDPLFQAIMSDVSSGTDVHDVIMSLTVGELEGVSDETMARHLIVNWLAPAELVDLVPTAEGGGPTEGEALWGVDGQPLIESRRIRYGWRVKGNAQWLCHWPWKASHQPLDPLEFERAVSRRSFDGVHEPECPFTVESDGFPHGAGIVHTFVDMYADEIDDAAATQLREQRLKERISYLVEYFAAHSVAVEACTERLVTILTNAVAGRRRSLQFDAAVSAGIDFPLEPFAPLEIADPTDEGAGASIELLRELSDSTFRNIVTVINGWRHTIESGGRYLCNLGEDGLTYTLLPTLAAAFGVAMHDAFMFLGHADVVIPAQQLAAARGMTVTDDHPPFFVAEAKKDASADIAESAVDQLADYLPRSHRHGCLIYYVTDESADGIDEVILSALRGHPDYVEDAEAIATVPVLTFRGRERYGLRSVAVAIVPLPPVTTRRAEDTARKAIRSAAPALTRDD